MAVETHSAQLRPGANYDEDFKPTNMNTLSQISSVRSNGGGGPSDSPAKGNAHPSSAYPFKGVNTALLPPKNQQKVKNIIKEQEKKLKMIDE